MKSDMIMPQMGESIVEGTIVKWRKKTGDRVEKDEMILEISTDKVDSEIPAPESGILVEILAKEGITVEVGVPIARIETDAAAVVATAKQKEPAVRAAAPVQEQFESAEKTAGKKFLSPMVKKIAKEHQISLDQVSGIPGSGANGRITKQDILAYLSNRGQISPSAAEAATPQAKRTPAPVMTPPVAQAPVRPETHVAAGELVEIITMDHVRKRIAEHMVFSKHTAAHVTSVAEVDVTAIFQYREKAKEEFEKREGVPLTYTAFFVEAVASALREYPLINSSVAEDKILMKKFINIGIAVGMDKGLIVPVIKNADQLNLTGVARAVYDLANRARTKQLKPDDVQGGTFSITNIGTFGNLFGTPIINQPQVAILGTGAIKKRPVVVAGDAIAIRSMMYVSLTYDHRIIDGLYGGSFLQKVVQLLENFQP